MNGIIEKQNEYKKIINENLDKYLKVHYPNSIWESMRYSVLADGKRIRPILTLEICNVLSGGHEIAIPTACAIEMLHAQSLIHDDLPCMDNDDFRRGKPTNHKVYTEATAVLAGDALLTLAPQIILQHTDKSVDKLALISILEEYCISAGAFGLIAGQIVDIESENKQIDGAELSFIHAHKTGMLFRLSLRAGAILAGADERTLNAITEFADTLGLAFQIADDILDETATMEELGKTPGKDKKANKATYTSMYGLKEALVKMKDLCNNAHNILENNNINSDLLNWLLDDMIKRVTKDDRNI